MPRFVWDPVTGLAGRDAMITKTENDSRFGVVLLCKRIALLDRLYYIKILFFRNIVEFGHAQLEILASRFV